MSGGLPNLDSRCAQFSYNIVNSIASNVTISKSNKSKLVNIIDKSLGVLQDNGIYAFFLYLDYRKDELGAEEIKENSLKLLRHEEIDLLGKNKDHLVSVRQLTGNLDRLTLAHRLLEQMLIYARYHAKSLRVTDDGM
ncbi:MAG TPA: hypothetical protein GXZ26_10075 [Firmicutes bacterium]|jgi:hypothetical protein|nr:hypothetical protein [Bacillota bacterium]